MVSNRAGRAWRWKQEYQNASESDLCPVFDYGTKEHLRISPELAVDSSLAAVVVVVCHSRLFRSVLAYLQSRIPLGVGSP